MPVEGKVHDREGLAGIDREPLQDEVVDSVVDLPEHLPFGDGAADGHQMVEGVEVGGARPRRIVLPATPDVDDTIPAAVVERHIADRFHVETDRHAACPVGGHGDVWKVPRVGRRGIKDHRPVVFFEATRLTLSTREEKSGHDE